MAKVPQDLGENGSVFCRYCADWHKISELQEGEVCGMMFYSCKETRVVLALRMSCGTVVSMFSATRSYTVEPVTKLRTA